MKVYIKSEGPKLWLAAAVPVQCSSVRVGWRFSCEGKTMECIEAVLDHRIQESRCRSTGTLGEQVLSRRWDW